MRMISIWAIFECFREGTDLSGPYEDNFMSVIIILIRIFLTRRNRAGFNHE
jgi:hypothetical protein